jgi:hypothetical protein
MQEAAGSCNGRTAIASTTANRIAVFRITDSYHNGLSASTVISDLEIGDYSDTQQITIT